MEWPAFNESIRSPNLCFRSRVLKFKILQKKTCHIFQYTPADCLTLVSQLKGQIIWEEKTVIKVTSQHLALLILFVHVQAPK